METIGRLLIRYRIFGLLLICALAVIGMIWGVNKSQPQTEPLNPLADQTASSDIVLSINGRDFTTDDIRFYYNQSGLDKASMDMDSAIQNIIDQTLLSEAAQTQQLMLDQDVNRKLEWARDGILSGAMVEQYVRSQITKDNLQRLYEAQSKITRPVYETRARQILIPDKETAEQVLKRIDNGDSFTTLAFAYSIDRVSRDEGGDMGYFTRDMLSPEVSEAAFSLSIGERADIFQSERGWHILEVTDRRRRQPPSFEDLKPELEAFLRNKALQELVTQLRSEARITINESVLDSFTLIPLKGSPKETSGK